ncbi:DUF6809 family protein [Neobittarella massiliensis]|uniref:DUF6809 family protein n=1 Tax=Neobittarella massiliensis (ex Bilen et al. 2018) TaxID=2041842 RepID=UPI000CF6C8F6|nr:DUF6809 family protein [Neobittarella massiliensis]
MQDILQALYYGNLCPADQIGPLGSDYRAANRESERQDRWCRENLPPEAYRRVQLLQSAATECNQIELYHTFCRGFSLGAQLLLAALEEPRTKR